METETAMLDHMQVSPRMLLGWLASAIEGGRSIDVAEWNTAIRAIQSAHGEPNV